MPPTLDSTEGFPVAETLYTERMVGIAISPITEIFMSFSEFVLSINCSSLALWSTAWSNKTSQSAFSRIKQLLNYPPLYC
jgi:hypothetical protein